MVKSYRYQEIQPSLGCPEIGGSVAVKYANADTQILTTKRQIMKTAVSAVSGLVSGSSLVETGALASLLRIYFRKIIVKNVAPNPLEK